MADNNENNIPHKKAAKKKCLLERIFGWICLAILLLLIVTLLVLRAPWTVVTILIAILVSTVVRKPVRKWIWCIAASIVIAFIVWVFLPDKTKGWRPYTFDKELAAMEAKRSVPTEDNAAAIYNQLLESHDPNSFDKDFLSWKNKDLILLEFWESKDYPEVASWLEDNQKILDQLMLTCKKDKCRFPIAGDISTPGLKPPAGVEEVTEFWWSLQSKRLAPMRYWYELLVCSANNDIAEGRVDEGLEKYIATLQMAKHLYQQPTPMDLLVGIAINLHGLDQINKYIVTGNATNEQLQLLDNTLQSIEYEWRADLHQILDREKLMFKNFMCAMFYQTNPKGKVRLNRDPSSALSSQIHVHYRPSGKPGSSFIRSKPGIYWCRKLAKAKAVLCWFFVPPTPQEAEMIIDDVHKQYYAMTGPEYDWQKEPKKFTLMTVRLNFRWLMEIMSGILENNWPTIHDRYLQATAWKRASQLIIALRRYKNKIGRWPKSLEEIRPLASAELFTDPINNSSFVYKLTEENFTLYSMGKNNIDEDGKRDDPGGSIRIRPGPSVPGKDKKVEPDDILIWSPEKRNLQSVKEAKKKNYNE
jgi:hypothetical protein